MIDIIGVVFVLTNIIGLVMLLPIIYPMLMIMLRKCRCAIDFNFVVIVAYVILTIAILISSMLRAADIFDLSQKSARMIIVVYFLLTIVFVEVAMRYVEKERGNCKCMEESYKSWLTSLIVIRWVGIYVFGVILLSAGLYLFIRSKQRPFSFPLSRR